MYNTEENFAVFPAISVLGHYFEQNDIHVSYGEQKISNDHIIFLGKNKQRI